MKAAILAASIFIVDQVVKELGPFYDDSEFWVNEEGALGIGSRPVLWMAFSIGMAFSLAPRWWIKGLLIGAGLSNLLDIFRFDGIRDPIPAGPIAFNIADVALLVGYVGWCVLIIQWLWRWSQPTQKEGGETV